MEISLTALLLVTFASLAACGPINVNVTDDPTKQVSVWTGQMLTLSCDADKDLAHFHRLWRKDGELLTASTVVITMDERFSVINEHELSMINVTAEDEGRYDCEIITKPSIHIKFDVYIIEVICGEPDQIPNGEFYPTPGSVVTFRYGDRVTYRCHQGYTLVGADTRTCLHPGTGWEGEVPKCELNAIADVSSRISTLEKKLYKLFNADMETFLKVEAKFSDLEGRVKQLEGDSDGVRNSHSKNERMEREMHHLKTALSLNALRDNWEQFLNADIAQLGVRDGHLVSEFTFLVRDIEEKIKNYRDRNFEYIESRPFYTHIPGYRMVLHVFPNYDQTDHVGLYAVLLQGKFDDVIAWPFTSKYTLSIGTVNPEASDVFDTIVPVRATTCRFERPPPDNDIGCGFAAFLDHKTLKENSHVHQLNGGILFRISIFLDD